jgi:methoxymalonate biosynthesis acyl carrier protein
MEGCMITISAQEAKQLIREFINDSISLGNASDDENLFETGIVNSLFAIQLMTFIEKTFQIEIGTDDLDIENFKSISSAAQFVLRKNGRHAG